MKFIRFLSISLFLTVGLFIQTQPVQAEVCDEHKCDSESSDFRACNERKQSCLEAAIKETRSKSDTLKNTISILNGQIQIQQLQINQTLVEIKQLEKEIEELGTRIHGLEISLDRMTNLLVERVNANYKHGETNPLLLLVSSNSFTELMSQIKYLQITQKHISEVMQKAEAQRLDYDQQKLLKEAKQKEIEQKKAQLQQQQNKMAGQKQEQQQLLTLTQNDEKRYQQLLSQTKAQLASFSSFASGVGISLLSGQTSCDSWGCYYSQRDSEWGNMYLSGSTYTMASSGCLVTSVAMMATHYGKSLTPAQIASSSVFSSGDLLHSLNVNGVEITRSSICSSSSCLDSALGEGNPVIVRLKAANSAGTHFIVILEKKDGNYIMHDPVIENGKYKKFTDYYSLDRITRVDRFNIK